MLEMFKNSVKLFFKGKLFRDNRAVFMQWFKGFVIVLVLLLAIGFLVNPLVGVIVASVVGGALQPYLFKDLKYD
ncbi:hypothetical protein TPL01_20290 [Sulfuriferula plumbiphila]|uniref:AI-2E family transporter n=1 Tax=Sulfuriferula plumbiphila TaxID=171865 RepID=A0A512L9T6_9PROT|nr:hypothetical protein [Sulfuriferula plumbiphila]BBP04279.1 hypothetical protein SFPGR_17010 [Sulfuriferula plumbiphila]GEP30891.1 hypothetical protein TPL01_20290 [Sulfuriferula plumbiphila]